MSAAVDWYGRVASSRDELTRTATSALRAATASSTSREVLSVFSPESDLSGRWQEAFRNRVTELASLPRDWDSYGGAQLQIEPVLHMQTLLTELDHYIQSPPSISMTGDGGLVCSWRRADYHLELTTDPYEEPRAYYWDNFRRQEWEGSVARAVNSLVKWVWQASSTY